jgi:hypothetical protein
LLVVASKIDDALNSSNSPRGAAGAGYARSAWTAAAGRKTGAMHKDVNEKGKTIELIVVEIK